MMTGLRASLTIITALLAATGKASWFPLPWKDQESSRLEEHRENLLASIDSLPAQFFSGESQTDTHCLLAYTEMSKLCDVSSERKRMYLAMLLTNCHLEAAGRKIIYWHPEHRLRDASQDEVDLVMQYVPLLRSICDRTGNGYDLAIFRMQVDTDMRLLENVEDLRQAVREANAVNLESERLKESFVQLAQESILRSKDIQDVTGNLRSATESLHAEHQELASLEMTINSTVHTLHEGNQNFSSLMTTFLQEAADQVQTLADHIQLQKEYNELYVNYSNLQEELLRQSNGSKSCFKNQIPFVGRALEVGVEFISLQLIWFSILKDAKDMAWKWLSFPLKLLMRLQTWKEYHWLNDRAKVVVAGAQVMVIISTISLLYWLLKLIRNFAALCGPLQLAFVQVSRPVRLLLAPSPYLRGALQNASFRSSACNSYSCLRSSDPARMESIGHESMHKGPTQATEGDSISGRGTRSEPAVREIIKKIEQLESGLSAKLLDRIHRIERRQIHIYNKLKSSNAGRMDVFALESNSALPRPGVRSRTEANEF